MKKTTSNILFIALMALLLFSLSGCAQEKRRIPKKTTRRRGRQSCNAAS